jgi:thiaminase
VNPMSVVDLPLRHLASWTLATEHPFLEAVRDGTVTEAGFEAWLVQDYRFVSDLLVFQGRLLARAPRPAQAVLAGGAVALVDELSWFEEQAAARHLDLATAPLPATAAYSVLLERLDSAEVAVALTALWAIERVYFDGWSFAAPGAPAYRAFVAHWTTPQFAAYVGDLGRAADDAVAIGPGGSEVEAAFVAVLDAESRFWAMTLEDDA